MERKQTSVKRARSAQSHLHRFTFGTPVNHDMNRVKHKKLHNVEQFSKLEDRWLEYQD